MKTPVANFNRIKTGLAKENNMKRLEFRDGHIKKLEWAISLLQRDIDKLREGDWLNLRDEMYDFIYKEDALIGESPQYPPLLKTKKAFVKNITPSVMGGIKTNLATYFSNFAFGFSPAYRPVMINEARMYFGAPSILSPFIWFISVDDDITAAVIALGAHLVGSGILKDQLRKCPECGNPFLLKRQPRSDRNFHCSLKCSRNAATKRYRMNKKEKLKAKERVRSRHRYVAKQQKKYGPNTDVARRPRKARGA